MSGNANQTPSAHTVALLLPKVYDADPDHRYMGLSDLVHLLNSASPHILTNDYNISAKTVDALLHALKDKNGEVQNMAIQCLGPFVNKAADGILCPMIDKISTLQTGDIVDESVPSLALRAIVISLPRPTPGVPRSKAVTDAASAISKALIPRLVGYSVLPLPRKDLPKPPKGMLKVDMENGTDSNAMDVLTEVGRCFGGMLAEEEVRALAKTSLQVLEHERTSSVLKKKAVVAISTLAINFSEQVLQNFMRQVIEHLGEKNLPKNKRKLYYNLLGSISRSIPKPFSQFIEKIAPSIFASLSQDEIDADTAMMEATEERDPESDEVRESALVALESFLASCTEAMRPFTSEAISSITRFLRYDPNALDDDEDMDEDDEEDEFANELADDEDFEEEIGIDDDDNTSWKVRRCAAKAAAVLIRTRTDLLQDGTLYSEVAPALVSRFKEKQESVRLEILSALALLIRVTSGRSASAVVSIEQAIEIGSMGPPPPSRKRRRGGSDASMLDAHHDAILAVSRHEFQSKAPSSSAMESLVDMSPEIVNGTAQLLKASPLPKDLPTKQASMALLKDLAVSLEGEKADYLAQTVEAVVESITVSGSLGSGASAANTNTFRIEALHFLSAVAQAHTTTQLDPYFAKIIPCLITASKEKFTKVALAALTAMEQYVLALTPPRSPKVSSSHQQYLSKLYVAVSDRIGANDADLDVRRLAIHVLGFILGLTSSTSGLISGEERKAGLMLLENRLKNELTRLASVKAVDTVLILTKDGKQYPPKWIESVALELGAQLRKASRALRGSSLAALKTLAVNPASNSQLSSHTISQLVPLLLPLLTQGDLHLIGPALLILSTFIQRDPKTVVNDNFIEAFCTMLYTPIAGSTLDSLLTCVRTIGEKGVGQKLMTTMLRDVSLNASTDIVGKVVGNLVVSGGSSVGVNLDAFIKEAKTAKDEKRRCLALSVLGEAALRLGPVSPLTPTEFIQYFAVKSDKVPLAAAVALGRAGAGNVPVYLPVILDRLDKMGAASSKTEGQKQQYLFLHALREILGHEGAESQIIPYAQSLWSNILTASQTEDNKTIGAECIGRLAIIDPKTYLPQLQVTLDPHQPVHKRKKFSNAAQTFLTDRNPLIRGMVISALRYIFADTDSSYDAYLAPLLIPMLKTMLSETDLENRRLALTTLNSAAHNKPDLILPHLEQLLPFVMKETVPDPALIREVQMGPFKHKVDDGLEIRKAAYETVHSLLSTPFTLSSMDLPTLFDRLTAGVQDDTDIRTLCTLMITKLTTLAPDEVRERLGGLVEPFKTVLSRKEREGAVKQEVERLVEERRDVVRCAWLLSRAFVEESGDAGSGWGGFWEWVRQNFASVVKGVEEEAREKDR